MPTSSELRSNPEQLLNFNEVRGEIIGWVKHDDLECPYDGNPWFIFNHGDQFLNTKLLPSKPIIIKSRKHLTNYINKVMSQNNLVYNIGPRLKAQQNISFPIKWLNTNLGSLFDQIINQA